MTFAVCDFAQNFVHIVTMVKVQNAGPEAFHCTVIEAFEIHGWFAQVQVFPEECFSLVQWQNVAACSGINLAVNLEDFVMKIPG